MALGFGRVPPFLGSAFFVAAMAYATLLEPFTKLVEVSIPGTLKNPHTKAVLQAGRPSLITARGRWVGGLWAGGWVAVRRVSPVRLGDPASRRDARPSSVNENERERDYSRGDHSTDFLFGQHDYRYGTRTWLQGDRRFGALSVTDLNIMKRGSAPSTVSRNHRLGVTCKQGNLPGRSATHPLTDGARPTVERCCCLAS